jgi:hypothetical protein
MGLKIGALNDLVGKGMTGIEGLHDKTIVAKMLGMKKGGKVKKMAKGGSASSRGDGCCVKGKTRGRMI